MSVPQTRDLTTAGRPTGRRGLVALLGAIGFVGFYLAMNFVRGAVGSGMQMPLPNAPAADIYGYLVGDPTGIAAAAGCMLLSVGGLLTFVLASRNTPGHLTGSGQIWGYRAGLLAVVALTLSTALSLVLAAAAPGMTVDTAVTLNTLKFIAGGTAHVALLGGYVWLTRGTYRSRGVRIFGIVAAVPAVLSLISLVWFYGSALILLGRLLCMAWTVTAGVALVRADRRPA